MKYLSLIFACLFFIQCGSKSSKPSEEGQEKAETSSTTYTRVKSIKTSFAFPERYKKYSIREAVEHSKTAGYSEEDSAFLHGTISYLQRHPQAEIYADRNGIYEQIVIEKKPYLAKMDSRSVGLGLGMVQSDLESAFRSLGAEVEVIDSKIMRSPVAQIAKGAFKIKLPFITHHMIMYLVTGKGRTFSVMVYSHSGDDLEDMIKSMKMH